MENVVFLRHSFRGALNIVGKDSIIIEGGNPELLKIPIELNSLYNRDIIIEGLDERIENIVKDYEIERIDVDYSKQRTFYTGKYVAKHSNNNIIYGIPTIENVGLDYSLVCKKIENNPETKLSKDDTKEALLGFGQALKDLGALK